MAEGKCTPRPWKVYYAKTADRLLLGVGRADTAEGIVDTRGGLWGTEDEAQANAELICRAVNAFDPLVSALEGLLLSADASWEAANAGHDWRDACKQARAALSLAKDGTK
jgi:hypothetical protein